MATSAYIEDWHRCVKHLSVSSRDNQAHCLIDGGGGHWQSSGSQGKVGFVLTTLLEPHRYLSDFTTWALKAYQVIYCFV